MRARARTHTHTGVCLAGLTQYDESFAPGTLSATLKPALEAVEASSSGAAPISSPLRFGAAKEHAKAMGTSPMRATGTLGATSASPSRTGGAPPSSSTGSAARTSNIMKGRSATAYGELDGTGADPWKLMDMLGYEVPKPRAAKK
ncbi:hypothetical protein EON67_00180 [archaeon]|nr:MAG: hypothetical protein EON67_00180 [archaeon]